MAKLIQLLEINIDTINKFVKVGLIPLSVLNDYDIYLFYKAIDYESRQMKKYEIISKKFKISIDTVRRSISRMEKKV